MNTLLIAQLADGRPWVAHRNARLNAARVFARLHPNAHVHRRVAAEWTTPDDMVDWLAKRRESSAAVHRYEEEGYLLAFETDLKERGKPKIAHRKQAEIRRWFKRDDPNVGFGLATSTPLFTIWEQCVARWHAREPSEMPRSVKLVITGCRNLNAVEEDIAALLADDAHLRRRRALPPSRHPNLREEIVGQWVLANGGSQGHLDIVTRMLGRDADHRLAELATEGGYATLAPEMVDLARQLANGDATLGFYVFRVLQRVAAGTVEGKAMWKATWLRGVKTDPNAIPGTSAHQIAINEILKTRVFEEEPAKGHSGAASIATTYRLRLDIRPGPCGPQDAARQLGLRLNAKGMPRRGG